MTIPSALHQLPLLIRGGSIVPTRDRPRRSSALMARDPFTLRIALDASEQAEGELYLDDGNSYEYEVGQLVWRKFTASKVAKGPFKITSEDLAALQGGKNVVDGVDVVPFGSQTPNAFRDAIKGVRVENVLVYGLKSKPSKVSVGGVEVEWTFTEGTAAKSSGEGTATVLRIRGPAVKIIDDWAIEVAF